MAPTGFDSTYRALLVANWTFPNDARLAPLIGPENDVRILAKALSDDDVGLFDPAHVETLAEPSIGELMPAVEEFFVETTSRDTRLFYFSGHGRLDQQDELFLCNRTTRVDRPFATALKSSDLRNLIERSAATCIVILDCCYSGKFKGGPAPKQLTGRRARGTFAITASRAFELAEDAHAPDHASLFTRHLVDGLRDPEIPGRDGLLSLEDLYAAVDKSMRCAVGQQPQKHFRGAGIPPIARRTLAVAAPPAPPHERLRLSTDRIDLGVIAHDEELPPERVAVLGVETDADWEVDVSDAWIAVTRHSGDILIEPTPAVGLSRANIYVRDLRTRSVATIRIRVERKPRAEPEPAAAATALEQTRPATQPEAEQEASATVTPTPPAAQPNGTLVTTPAKAKAETSRVEPRFGPEKVSVIAEVRERFEESSAAFLIGYRGLDLGGLAELRRVLRDVGSEYEIYMNGLLRYAARDAGLDLDELLTGPTAIAFVRERPDGSAGDPVPVAKALREFSRVNSAVVLKGGVVSGAVLAAEEVRALADIEPREVLLTRLAGALAAPLQQFASLLEALPRTFAFGRIAMIEQDAAERERRVAREAEWADVERRARNTEQPEPMELRAANEHRAAHGAVVFLSDEWLLKMTEHLPAISDDAIPPGAYAIEVLGHPGLSFSFIVDREHRIVSFRRRNPQGSFRLTTVLTPHELSLALVEGVFPDAEIADSIATYGTAVLRRLGPRPDDVRSFTRWDPDVMRGRQPRHRGDAVVDPPTGGPQPFLSNGWIASFVNLRNQDIGRASKDRLWELQIDDAPAMSLEFTTRSGRIVSWRHVAGRHTSLGPLGQRVTRRTIWGALNRIGLIGGSPLAVFVGATNPGEIRHITAESDDLGITEHVERLRPHPADPFKELGLVDVLAHTEDPPPFAEPGPDQKLGLLDGLAETEELPTIAGAGIDQELVAADSSDGKNQPSWLPGANSNACPDQQYESFPGGPLKPEPISGWARIRRVLAAGFWSRRLGARAIDAFVAASLLILVGVPVALADMAVGGEPDARRGGLIWLVWLLAVAAYEVVGTLRSGATLGKRAVGLRIIDRQGAIPQRKRMIVRTLGAVGMLVLFPVGLLDAIWPLWDPDGEALHDKIAGTRVGRGR